MSTGVYMCVQVSGMTPEPEIDLWRVTDNIERDRFQIFCLKLFNRHAAESHDIPLLGRDARKDQKSDRCFLCTMAGLILQTGPSKARHKDIPLYMVWCRAVGHSVTCAGTLFPSSMAKWWETGSENPRKKESKHTDKIPLWIDFRKWKKMVLRKF